MRIDDLIAFMQARHAIYLKRKMNLPKPWTSDPILQDYRFCNVYRELDRETMWIKENWREPLKDHSYLFFAMTVARVVNWSPTLEEMRLPIPSRSIAATSCGSSTSAWRSVSRYGLVRT